MAERGLEKGSIPHGTELFLFTDNFVVERAYFHGTSKSKMLFKLVLCLRKLEMFVHLIWVAGTRMIAQGTDGILCGDFGNGVMNGRSMLEFIPLHEGLDSRGTPLVKWFAEASGEGWRILEPKEWFHKVHTAEGKYI
jgi:hypothetical protein